MELGPCVGELGPCAGDLGPCVGELGPCVGRWALVLGDRPLCGGVGPLKPERPLSRERLGASLAGGCLVVSAPL